MAWVAAAVYLAWAGACFVLAARSSAQFVDSRVYRMGGAAVLHGEDLSRLRLGVLPFTYPPFAAVLLTALAPSRPARPWCCSSGASVAAMPVTLYLALRLSRFRRAWSAGRRIGSGGGAGRGGGGYLAGSRQGRARLRPGGHCPGRGGAVRPGATGYLHGGRARRSDWPRGIKLTPAIFVAYLLLTRRYRAAATAATVFAATVAAGFAVIPASSAWYWAGEFANPGHVSPVQDRQNQSLSASCHGRCTP